MKSPVAKYEIVKVTEENFFGEAVFGIEYWAYVRVLDAFDIKEDLKQRGYRWFSNSEWWGISNEYRTEQEARQYIEQETMWLEKNLGVEVDDGPRQR